MVSNAFYRKCCLVLLLIATPVLVGSQCAVFFSSGGGSNDKDKDEQIVVVANSSFGTAPAAGIDYTSGSISGVTGSNGEFQYEIDQPVQFSIGDIPLGRAVGGKSVITPQDLVPGGDTTAAINMERLLQSLDADPGDSTITIPAGARARAVRSDQLVASAIDYLDFSDDTAFANAASQLVAVMTADYPFTGVLVDAGAVQVKSAKSM